MGLIFVSKCEHLGKSCPYRPKYVLTLYLGLENVAKRKYLWFPPIIQKKKIPWPAKNWHITCALSRGKQNIWASEIRNICLYAQLPAGCSTMRFKVGFQRRRSFTAIAWEFACGFMMVYVCILWAPYALKVWAYKIPTQALSSYKMRLTNALFLQNLHQSYFYCKNKFETQGRNSSRSAERAWPSS